MHYKKNYLKFKNNNGKTATSQVENSPSHFLLNTPEKEISVNSDLPSEFDYDEYIQMAEMQSNLKNMHFKKSREKCLEITVTDDNISPNFNTIDKEISIRENILNVSKSNKIISQVANTRIKTNMSISPTTNKLQVKGNIIKKNLKIKLLKDDFSSNFSKNTRRKKYFNFFNFLHRKIT
jgi:hypothetical protein